MSKTLTEVLAQRQEASLNSKLAHIEQAFGSDPELGETLNRSLDIVKEAGVTDPEIALDLATQMTIDHHKLQKEAASEESTDVELDEEGEAAFTAGMDAAEVAHAAGVTLEDVEKLGSAEDAARFGELLCDAVLKSQPQA